LKKAANIFIKIDEIKIDEPISFALIGSSILQSSSSFPGRDIKTIQAAPSLPNTMRYPLLEPLLRRADTFPWLGAEAPLPFCQRLRWRRSAFPFANAAVGGVFGLDLSVVIFYCSFDDLFLPKYVSTLNPGLNLGLNLGQNLGNCLRFDVIEPYAYCHLGFLPPRQSNSNNQYERKQILVSRKTFRLDR
jgi:hypothetical protein